MQPWPSEATEQSSRSSSPRQQTDVAHHGSLEHNPLAGAQLRDVELRDGELKDVGSSLSASTAAARLSPQSSTGLDTNADIGRLKTPSAPPSPPLNKVEEYDNAPLHHSRPGVRDVTSQVDSRLKLADNEGCGLLDLPNGKRRPDAM